ncbi:hypothetical protein C8R43DRAFT_1133598 [Mycena crocata]|nr:hypothetical protein C8R43DRAFT_1133598 [Mycena crocata]
MSAQELVRMAVISKKSYRMVALHMDFLRDHGGEEEEYIAEEGEETDDEGSDVNMDETDFGPPDSHVDGEDAVDAHLNLPTDIGLRILRDVVLADQINMALSFPGAAHVVAEALQTEAASVLSRFHLRFGEIRLMMAATGAIVSGSTITALLRSDNAFIPSDLDFFTGAHQGYDVVQFLKKAGRYKITSVGYEYDLSTGVGKVWGMERFTGQKVNVVESLTDNPYDAVANFHSTCVFGAWDARKLWLGYPELTAAGISLTTPALMPATGDLAYHQRLWRILKKWTGRDFSFALAEFGAPHECGEEFSCPVKYRTSDDAGCAVIDFPSWTYDDDFQEHPRTGWNLGGAGCTVGVLAQGGIAPSTLPRLSLWRQKLRKLIALSEEPRAESQYRVVHSLAVF